MTKKEQTVARYRKTTARKLISSREQAWAKREQTKFPRGTWEMFGRTGNMTGLSFCRCVHVPYFK